MGQLALAAIGRAAAFSFAGILAFATVVTGLAAASALTGILSLAAMLIRDWGAVQLSRVERGVGGGGGQGRGGFGADGRAAEQASHGRAREE